MTPSMSKMMAANFFISNGSAGGAAIEGLADTDSPFAVKGPPFAAEPGAAAPLDCTVNGSGGQNLCPGREYFAARRGRFKAASPRVAATARPEPLSAA